MSNTVSVYNFKGGVGKTTTSLNLGYSWSRFFKVLLIDFDPQCNLTNALSIGNDHKTVYTYVTKILHNHPIEVEPVEVTPYLDIIPGDYSMVNVESNNQFISFGHTIMQKFLYAAKTDYDFVILDCPTNFGVLIKSILSSTKSVLIPAVADSFSISGIKKLLTHMASVDQNYSLNILGIFFNMYNDHLKLSHEKLEEAKHIFGDLILENTISRSIKIGEANNLGKPISELSPDNTVAREFMALSDELLAKIDSQYLTDEYIMPELLEKVRIG